MLQKFSLDFIYVYKGGTYGAIVIVVGDGHGDLSSNSRKAVCISHGTYTNGKGLNPNILLLAMAK